MKRSHFSKKKILGHIKTFHANKRQLERGVTDKVLAKILIFGEFVDRGEHQVVIEFDGYQVHLSHDLEKIITVIAPDKNKSNLKILSVSDAKALKEIIQNISNSKQPSGGELSFDDYMKSEN